MRRPKLTGKRARGLRIICSLIRVDLEADSLYEQGIIDEAGRDELKTALEYLYQLADYHDMKTREADGV